MRDRETTAKAGRILLYTGGLVLLVLALFLFGWWFNTRPLPPLPPAPPTERPLTQMERLRAGLQAELQAGSVTLEPAGQWIAIRVGNLNVFEPARAEVLRAFRPVAERIAFLVERERGPVRVVGHTDTQPLQGGGPFRDNQALSVARAQAVADLLLPGLSDRARVRVEGRGAEEPVADNATAEGRARNRRVEVLVTRE